MACGGYADGTWYYSTSWVRWYCGAKLAITNPDTGECVVVEVADAGPAAWVEETAGMPIVDASPLVCEDLFSSSSCGWSDSFVIEVVQVPDETPSGRGMCPTEEPEPEPELFEPIPEESLPAENSENIEPIQESSGEASELQADENALQDVSDAFTDNSIPSDITFTEDSTGESSHHGENNLQTLEGGCACTIF